MRGVVSPAAFRVNGVARVPGSRRGDGGRGLRGDGGSAARRSRALPLRRAPSPDAPGPPPDDGAPPGAVAPVVVIGSGAAAYTAAIYAARADLAPVVFEGAPRPSPDADAPADSASSRASSTTSRMRAQATRWGASVVAEDVVAVDVATRPFEVRGRRTTAFASALIVADDAPEDPEEDPEGGTRSPRSPAAASPGAVGRTVPSVPGVFFCARDGEGALAAAVLAERFATKEGVAGSFEPLSNPDGSEPFGFSSKDGPGALAAKLAAAEEERVRRRRARGRAADSDVAYSEPRDAGSNPRRRAEEEEACSSSSATEDASEDSSLVVDLDATRHSGRVALKRLYLESDRPVVVLYSAEGCAPCARLRPMLDAVIDEYEGERRGRGARGRGDERMDREGNHRSGSSAARSRASSSRRGRVHFVSVDVGLDPEVGEAAGIGGTPCVHVFVNREKRAHIEGVTMKTAYRSAIDACFVGEEGGGEEG